MRSLLAIALLSVISTGASSQRLSPNMGDKVCPLWTFHREAAKAGTASPPFPDALEWWVWGYLKGMSDQYTFQSKAPNPLAKLREGEELPWMDSYCKLHKSKTMADGALALLDELSSRR